MAATEAPERRLNDLVIDKTMLETDACANDVLSVFCFSMDRDFHAFARLVLDLKASVDPMVLIHCLDQSDPETVTRESLQTMVCAANRYQRNDAHFDFLLVILACKRRL
jgi:hypothetical protein